MTTAITQGSAQDAELIANLRQLLDTQSFQLASVRESLRESRNRHVADIATIGEKLIGEANDRDWCEEYDTIVEELNGDLHITLPVREREFTVEVSVVLTITVNAKDEADAREKAGQIADEVEASCDEHEGVVSAFESDCNFEVEAS